jgi:FkbM family methyltransferase
MYNSVFFKLVPSNYLYKPGTFRTINRQGINVHVDISDYVGHYLYFGFKDEGYITLFSLVKPLDVVIDVGANIGFTALSLSQRTESGKVFAFEPDPHNFAELQKNLHLNPGLNVEPLNLGVSDLPGVLKLTVSKADNRGMNRVNNSATENYTSIPVISLDEFVRERNIQRLNLIKIDVEGFEHNVLKGCVNILNNQKPAFFIELDDNNLKEQGSSSSELVAFLLSNGYRCEHSITKKEIAPAMDFSNKHFDIICIPIR